MSEEQTIRNFRIMLERIKSISEKYKLISQQLGENYNLFKVIGITTDEVRLHSAFIADLLNPKGAHGQGDLFLDLFLKDREIDDFDSKSATVYCEYYIGKMDNIEGGRLDIAIFDKNERCIVIENKIYASDQPNQLIRYHNFAVSKDKVSKEKNRKNPVYYLTLYGELPNEEISCSDISSSINLKEGDDYFLLSYRSDITKWLEACREKSVKLPLLREGISHYLNLINDLTGQTSNNMMKEELVETLLNTDYIVNLAEIKEGITLAEIELQKRFWKGLLAKAEKKGYEIVWNDFKNDDFSKVKIFYDISRNNKYYGFTLKVGSYHNVEILYDIRIDNCIYCGFLVKDSKETSRDEKYIKYVEVIKKIDNKYRFDSIWHLGWKHTTININFKKIDSATIEHLSNMEKTLTTMFDKIMDDIESFKKIAERSFKANSSDDIKDDRQNKTHLKI